jgi:hypothetical protein
MKICPQNNKVFLPKYINGIGEIIAPAQLTHPTMYEPYLAVIEIAPLSYISPKIVLE